MSNLQAQTYASLRKFGLPVLALAASVVSPVAGAVLGAFALKQISNRQSDPAKRKLAFGGMMALIGFAAFYTAVTVVILSTGYDLYP
jgi:chromate transport protein ChrA